VFLEPVRAAFRVQPNGLASLMVLLLFAVRAAPALSAPLASLAASVEETIFRADFFRAEAQFIVSTVSIVRRPIFRWVAADDAALLIVSTIVSGWLRIVSHRRRIVSTLPA
jgi:hypothetical protein